MRDAKVQSSSDDRASHDLGSVYHSSDECGYISVFDCGLFEVESFIDDSTGCLLSRGEMHHRHENARDCIDCLFKCSHTSFTMFHVTS